MLALRKNKESSKVTQNYLEQKAKCLKFILYCVRMIISSLFSFNKTAGFTNQQISSKFSGQPGRRLNEYVQHFEPLSYTAYDHSRSKRSSDADESDAGRVRIDFESHGRKFNLDLQRDLSVFPSSVVIEDVEGRRLQHLEDNAHKHLYEGRLLGEPESHAFGALRDGVFDGQIRTQADGLFYVERAQKYFPKGSNDTFHSIIYHEDHLTDPFHHSRHGELPIT